MEQSGFDFEEQLKLLMSGDVWRWNQKNACWDRLTHLIVENVNPIAELHNAVAWAGSQKQWADDHGISYAYVSDVLQGKREPGDKVLDALGLVKVVTYQRRPE